MTYENLPHTGDVKVRATGKTKAGLYQEVLRGMFAAAAPSYVRAVEPEGRVPKERPFSVVGVNAEEVLVNILNEAVALSDVHHESYEGIKFTLVTDQKAEGSFLDREITRFGTQIKAATHHDLQVKKNETGEWEAIVTLDV